MVTDHGRASCLGIWHLQALLSTAGHTMQKRMEQLLESRYRQFQAILDSRAFILNSEAQVNFAKVRRPSIRTFASHFQDLQLAG